MPLTCSCNSGYDDYDWYYRSPDDYYTLQTSRRKRCSSCKVLIDKGAIVTEFERFRIASCDIEEDIYGTCGEIELASYYLCETCADLWFSLYELGFKCVSPDENMRELAKMVKQREFEE